ncbi:MAG TPA: histone deacetylase family protein [Gammaproteobacteria bacterium]|nr:histone deacetylase family protein [Gammaproteobacteria bacterium]
MTTAFITHPACLKHQMEPGHPESPARLMAITDQLIASGLHDFLRHYEAPRASRVQLERVHAAAHLDTLAAAAPREGLVNVGPDICMNPGTWEAALHAAGAVVLGTDLVMAGTLANAFCSIRPPGHHANRDQAMGFCLLNNVAVGAAHALAAHGLTRIAIADFDVHHGNGTEDIFRDDPRVLLCSLFQHPLYPHTGLTSNDHVINVPLPRGTDGAGLRRAVLEHWLPALQTFRPQMIFISAGFDGHWQDEIADLALVEADYAWITQQLKAIASTYSEGRIVSTLEGGYELHALGRSVTAHIRVLSGL